MKLQFIRRHRKWGVGDVGEVLHEGVANELIRRGLAHEFVEAPVEGTSKDADDLAQDVARLMALEQDRIGLNETAEREPPNAEAENEDAGGEGEDSEAAGDEAATEAPQPTGKKRKRRS